MIDDFAKEYLLNDLRDVREAIVWKLDGLSEYDIRRPLTHTGTNLLGLIKHLATTEAWYFGDVFGRHFPGAWLTWDDPAAHRGQMWVTAEESRADIVDRYQLAWQYSDATIAALAIDAPGQVLWWPRPNVKLFNVMVHVLTETSRHAGHADILREQLDGTVGTTEGSQMKVDQAFWEARRAKIEQAAKAADPHPEQPPAWGSTFTESGIENVCEVINQLKSFASNTFFGVKILKQQLRSQICQTCSVNRKKF